MFFIRNLSIFSNLIPTSVYSQCSHQRHMALQASVLTSGQPCPAKPAASVFLHSCLLGAEDPLSNSSNPWRSSMFVFLSTVLRDAENGLLRDNLGLGSSTEPAPPTSPVLSLR